MVQFLRANGVQDGRIPDSEVVIENESIVVRRPWAQSLLTNRTKAQMKSLKKKVELTEEQKAERAKMLRRMAIERKKALKAEAKRAKLKRLNKIDEEDGTVSTKLFSTLNNNLTKPSKISACFHTQQNKQMTPLPNPAVWWFELAKSNEIFFFAFILQIEG